MTNIISILNAYRGTGLLLLLYAAALIVLLVREKDKTVRVMLGYVPLTMAILFVLPPFYKIYDKIEGADTYYRLLWMLPMGATIAWTGTSLLKKGGKAVKAGGFALLCAAIVLCGQYTYSNINISKAENRLHIPQNVIDLCDYIVSVSEGSRNIMVAMPSELVHFVRQYDTSIRMPFGREMLVASWGFENDVYDAMEVPEVINSEKLAGAAKEAHCNYIVLAAARALDEDLSEYGYEKMIELDGYVIYRDPGMPLL